MVLAKNQTAVVVTVHATTQRIAPLALKIVAFAHFVVMARAMAQRIVPLVLMIVALAPVQIVLPKQRRVYARTVLHHALPMKIAQKKLWREPVSTVPEVVYHALPTKIAPRERVPLSVLALGRSLLWAPAGLVLVFRRPLLASSLAI